MSDLALRVEGLGKRYRIGADQSKGSHRYKSLRDSLGGIARRPIKAVRDTLLREPMGESNSFWALKDINFEVKRGEVLGIIGRNGAGKSTLLKILSRITKPTVGHVALYGRVGSLLEVGTGFHPELTGRENIYLNGAILGMTSAEVKGKFDEIIAFSEVEKFLDTAVKHYSSGMYMRLAFAVAAHLDPEILVVDEVLAVGDAEFQKKCIGKMGEVAQRGRTVLFVSHNLAAVQSICTRAVLLAAGRVAKDDEVAAVAAYYRSGQNQDQLSRSWIPNEEPGSDRVKLRSVSARPLGSESEMIYRSDGIEILIEFDLRGNPMRLNPHLHIFTQDEALLLVTTNLGDPAQCQSVYEAGRHTATCTIPGRLLNEGMYYISTFVVSNTFTVEAAAKHAIALNILDDGADRGDYLGTWPGAIRPTFAWRIEKSYATAPLA